MGLFQSHDGTQQCTFSCAVSAEQCDELSSRDVGGDFFQQRTLFVSQCQIFELNHLNIRKFLPITHKITGTPSSAVIQFTGSRNFLAMM